MGKSEYIHGVHQEEQGRLRLLNRLTNQAFLDFVQFESGEHLLELGSGLGILAHAFAERNPDGAVTGIEYSAEQIAGCEDHMPNLQFIQGDAHHLPFENERFDVVYGRYILEHLHAPPIALEEAYRVLKPGGRIYFQENTISLVRFFPECPHFDEVWRQFIRLQSALGGDAEIGVKLYSLLKEAGFLDLQLSFAEEIHYHEKGTLIAWTDNIIGNVESGAAKLLELQFATEQQITEAIGELKAIKRNELASAYFCWNRARARKG